MTDMVNNPQHYKLSNGMEAIDMIEALLTEEEFRGYLKGNDLKYMIREPHKGNSEQDVAKSIWYAERYKEALAKKPKVEVKRAERIIVPGETLEFLDTNISRGEIATQRMSMELPAHKVQRLASQIMHPAYSDCQLVLTWEKK